MMTAVKLRRLRTSDLDRIEELERESYPTPWSRSMFAGELAKPSGICLGAFQGADMLGYLIVARYVDAWHVMNVAVEPDYRRRGIATTLLERLFDLTAGSADRGYTLEVRVSNKGAIRYRDHLHGLEIPADDSPLHVPWARHHAALAGTAGPPEPLYLRVPDADRAAV